MRKLILFITVFTFGIINLQAQQEGAGFFTYQPGEKYIVGSDDITDIWVKYIEAHNKRDMKAIISMDSDNISIVGPDGSRINGKEMHEQALLAWFEAEDPKWEIYWALPYQAVESGVTWIVAGHSVTLTVDGKEVKVNSTIDGEIIDGKIARFFVYNMDVPDDTPTE